MINFIIYLIIGGLAGAVAGRLMSGHGYGIVVDVILGIVGGFVGGYIVGLFTHHEGGGLIFEFLVALVGACILVAIVHLIKKEPLRT
jgi:uncharacterized membrane protein YeaQ/YmgE (transglycosylase-associated protein family)